MSEVKRNMEGEGQIVALKISSVNKNHFLNLSGCNGGNMGLINKVDLVCLSPVGYGV